jgi:hypothetical protein
MPGHLPGAARLGLLIYHLALLAVGPKGTAAQGPGEADAYLWRDELGEGHLLFVAGAGEAEPNFHTFPRDLGLQAAKQVADYA